jgi:hypothetical protein
MQKTKIPNEKQRPSWAKFWYGDGEGNFYWSETEPKYVPKTKKYHVTGRVEAIPESELMLVTLIPISKEIDA